MKVVSYRNGQFYVDGQEVPSATAWKVAEKEYARLHYQHEALKAENEALRARIAAIES